MDAHSFIIHLCLHKNYVNDSNFQQPEEKKSDDGDDIGLVSANKRKEFDKADGLFALLSNKWEAERARIRRLLETLLSLLATNRHHHYYNGEKEIEKR